jgi:hypothetical protein
LGAGNPVDIFEEFVRTTLPPLLVAESSLREARFLPYKTPPALEERTLRVPGLISSTVVTMLLPTGAASLEFDGFDADFVLFLGSIRVSREKSFYPPDDFDPVLKYRADFAPWDNRLLRVVSHGTAESEEVLSGAFIVRFMTRATWEQGLRQLARALLSNSDLKR